jgi:hypothetical protein
MQMAIQRQGYYENGAYFISDTTNIPSGRTRITVIFHDVEDKTQQRVTAIKGILSDALRAEQDLTDADWEEMANLRLKTNLGLSRGVNL